MDCALHDDLHLVAFTKRAVRLQFMLHLDADFADIFEVKSQSLPPRLAIRRAAHRKGVVLSYEKAGFRRGLRISLDPAFGHPVFIGARIVFELHLDPGAEWKCCLEARPEVDGKHIAVVDGTMAAPLWGMPPLDHEQGHESKPGHASAKEKGAREDASKDT